MPLFEPVAAATMVLFVGACAGQSCEEYNDGIVLHEDIEDHQMLFRVTSLENYPN